MVRRWTAGELAKRPAPQDVQLRELDPSDDEDLGRLLWSGFGREGPDGFASASSAREEARATLAGKWGSVIWAASVLAVTKRTAVAASVVLSDEAHQGLPLLAFLVTDPARRRRGIAETMLGDTLLRMDALDLHELHLAVSAGNPARRLYRRLGFTEESRGAATPG